VFAIFDRPNKPKLVHFEKWKTIKWVPPKAASIRFANGNLRIFRVSLLISTSPASALLLVRALLDPGRTEKMTKNYIDRLITSKDHASVQISIVDVDAEGKALQTSTTFAFCGQVRANGESDDSLNRLATKAGCECPRVLECARELLGCTDNLKVLKNVWSYQK